MQFAIFNSIGEYWTGKNYSAFECNAKLYSRMKDAVADFENAEREADEEGCLIWDTDDNCFDGYGNPA